MTMTLNYTTLGAAVRQSALDAHEGVLPHVSIAYQFMLDNPECFSARDTADMPAEPPVEFITAYYRDSEVKA